MNSKSRLAIAAGIIASSLYARSGAAPGADVVPFRGPNRDGTFPGTLPQRLPSAAWTFQTGGPVHGSPIWVDGLVLVGSGDGNFYAIDGVSGAERWRLKTGGAVDGPAAYAAGNVIFESRDGNLYAADV